MSKPLLAEGQEKKKKKKMQLSYTTCEGNFAPRCSPNPLQSGNRSVIVLYKSLSSKYSLPCQMQKGIEIS